MFQLLFLFVFFLLMYLVYFAVNEYRPIEREMDWMSYILAKGTKLYLPNPLMQNTSASIAATRKQYDFTQEKSNAVYINRRPELKKIADSAIDLKIPVDGAEIDIRIYNANPDHSSQLRPVLVWYHGGGMVIGSMKVAHGNCVKIANHTGFVVVSVEYRLAPEFVYPTPVNDAYSAFLWVEQNIAKYGGDAKQLTIGGDSAGGYLATVVTARNIADHLEAAREKCSSSNGNAESCQDITSLPNMHIRGILNVYPGLNATSESEEALIYGASSGILTTATVRQFRNLYQGSPVPDFTVRNHYWFSPLNTPSDILRFFPPNVLVLAQFDPLVVEGLEFKARLEQLGIKYELLMYNSIHGFYGDNLIPAGNRAILESCQSLLKLIR